MEHILSGIPHERAEAAALHKERNPRTAGYMPVYKGGLAQGAVHKNHYAPVQAKPDLTISSKEKNPDQFSFWDMIDIINPLQHVPVLNMVYREVTGDNIKPIGKILGGAVFGGAAGAAGGLVTAVLEDGTGKDVVRAASDIVGIKPKSHSTREAMAYADLPASLLAFSSTPVNEVEIAIDMRGYDKKIAADGRTAGTVPVYS